MDSRVADSLERIESHIDYRPIIIASWGLAGMTVLGTAAAGLATVAAGASAYVGVRMAIKVTREAREDRAKRLGARDPAYYPRLRSLPEDLLPEAVPATQPQRVPAAAPAAPPTPPAPVVPNAPGVVVDGSGEPSI
jgi:hypothetical protein